MNTVRNDLRDDALGLYTATPDEVRILMLISEERRHQDSQWGVQNHSFPEWAAILGEEYGEACQAVNKAHFAAATPERLKLLQQELVQVAAVAACALEQIARRTPANALKLGESAR